MMAEKGFTNAEVDAHGDAGGRRPEAGERHVQRQRRAEDQDPRASSSSATRRSATARCRSKMKENKPKGILSFITGGGTYKEAKFEADADLRRRTTTERGLRAAPGSASPSSRCSRTPRTARRAGSSCAFRSPRAALPRRRVRRSTATPSSGARPCGRCSRSKPGEWYSRKKRPTTACSKAQEIYGGGGYMEFTGVPRPQAERRPGREAQLTRWCPRRCARRRSRPGQQPSADRRRHDADRRKGSSTSSTASPSSATRRRATT